MVPFENYATDPALYPVFEVYFFLLGAVLGSFLNVCIYRVPRHQSIVIARSACPHCGALIRWYQNIPILSFLFLRARCANCKERISWVYPFVEAITGIFFLLLFLKFGLTLPLLIYGFFGACMIVLIFIDYFHKLLPAKITIPGVILGFLSSFVNPLVHPRDSLFGILLGALTLFSVYIAFKLIRNKEALGHGDIVMLAMVGAFLGWQQVLLVLFISSLLGSLVGVVFIVILRKGFDYMLPYGTFIGIAALPAVFWGQKILNYYFLV